MIFNGPTVYVEWNDIRKQLIHCTGILSSDMPRLVL